MSNPKYWWYYGVVRVIRSYPVLRELKDARQAQSVTATWTGMPGAHMDANRKTESVALRQLSPREEDDIRAVELAIETISQAVDGGEVMAVVRLYHWRRYDFATIAYKQHISERTARRMNGRFVHEVAKNMGYL